MCDLVQVEKTFFGILNVRIYISIVLISFHRVLLSFSRTYFFYECIVNFISPCDKHDRESFDLRTIDARASERKGRERGQSL